ncbi:MAG: helix-turn-helix domain-containing protein [Deinococcota bacterium]|jgi:HTH-type transcriptional regulator/antitoxin HigA|nr:helix-turn-helix domain-containing protein [Deinococcota bacterium]
MNIRPIKPDADHEAALADIETLLDAEPNTPAGDRLLVLTALAQAYEEEHYAIPAPDPVAAVMYYLESRGLSQEDLAPYLGSPSQVSAVLERRQPLTLEMIRQLHAGLGISAEVLIQTYDIAGNAA